MTIKMLPQRRLVSLSTKYLLVYTTKYKTYRFRRGRNSKIVREYPLFILESHTYEYLRLSLGTPCITTYGLFGFDRYDVQ